MASEPSSARLLRLGTYASVATAAVLIAAKLFAWLVTGSMSVLASLVDSLMDVGASLVNLVAVRYSLMPADAEHRFGHGKAEALAGLAQATFIAGSAVFLILEAVDRLRHPRGLEQIGLGVAVMVFSIVVTLGLLVVQRRVIARTGSTAIRADALHYATDVATGASVILALVLTRAFGWTGVDAWFAIAISLYILASAWRIGRDAFHVLLDRELPAGERQRIKELAGREQQVKGVHGLRTRQSGRQKIIQLHLELDASLSLSEAHRIADAVEARILDAFPDADVIIHQDPV
ncbi:MAG TPA: cation diffusion facilitator family transporter [Gammaproteobacteria bacterium]|nr:cation diffusion facilitator family transporter [Gammaproteobacteria bacterium]